MNHIIRKIQKKKLNIDVISNSRDAVNLTKWGNLYIARPNFDVSQDFSFFTFYFKDSSVRVDSYDIISFDGDVYPTNWTLSVSDDNKNWIEIDRKDQPLCNPSYIEYKQIEKRYLCALKETFHFTLSAKRNEFYKYVKFQMLKNSYYSVDNWYDQFTFYGFELNGNFFVPYKGIPTCKCHKINLIKLSSLIIVSLIS